jgi:hypothetical protein
MKTAVCAFFNRLLTPVARILLRHGVSFRELSDLCKRVYVDVATDEYGVDGRPTNVSRVALLTGMTRRDVRKVQLGSDETEQQALGRMNIAARVLSGWYQDPDFCDSAGSPLPLQEAGTFPSFAHLAKRYAVDIPITTTLKELRNAAAIESNPHGLLLPKTRYYMPGSANPAAPEAIMRASSVFEDLGNTIDYNLTRTDDDVTRFERRAANINISAETVAEFRAFVEKEGQAFLERVDSWLSRHEIAAEKNANNIPGTQPTIRLGLGMYWIQDSPDWRKP